MEIFRKSVTKTDVCKFSVPIRALKSLPGFGEGQTVRILVTDRMGRVHNIGCRIRKQGHPKPVFDSGWSRFVRENDVRIGDEIIFLAAGGQYRIEVWRSVKLFRNRFSGQV